MRKHTETLRKARKQFCLALLDDILEPMRYIASQNGYALAVHGSLSRDIDIVAIPWVEHVQPPDRLAKDLCSVLKTYFGTVCTNGKPDAKPHGRVAYTIIMGNTNVWIDLSVMPTVKSECCE